MGKGFYWAKYESQFKEIEPSLSITYKNFTNAVTPICNIFQVFPD